MLGTFGKEDRPLVEEALGNAAEAAAMIIQGKIDEAMNRFNRTKEAPKPDKE